MYSTNIRHDRCRLDCIAVSDEVAIEKFIVDTGAKYTCCNYWFIDENLSESSLKNKEMKKIGGMVEGETVDFYRFPLRQFTIGNIDMGEQDIWITFDERVTDIILGMDILKKIVMIINPYDQKIYFCKDIDDYNNNFELLTE